ncbi:uncharacterized protein LOC124084081 [Marmota monax]|uniref:uncharacterized protein LOC124084081 n=1 Tax=Marmota monax TaxID=9995 RepID=UPI001EAF951C|nr:uncharacterized protein LOC124084081 [Marmota monax]
MAFCADLGPWPSRRGPPGALALRSPAPGDGGGGKPRTSGPSTLGPRLQFRAGPQSVVCLLQAAWEVAPHEGRPRTTGAAPGPSGGASWPLHLASPARGQARRLLSRGRTQRQRPRGKAEEAAAPPHIPAALRWSSPTACSSKWTPSALLAFTAPLHSDPGTDVQFSPLKLKKAAAVPADVLRASSSTGNGGARRILGPRCSQGDRTTATVRKKREACPLCTYGPRRKPPAQLNPGSAQRASRTPSPKILKGGSLENQLKPKRPARWPTQL